VLDVRKGGMFKVAYQVRRHTEDTADLGYLELPSLKELRFVVGHGDGFELHALFQDGHSPAVGGSAVRGIPTLPQNLGILDRVGVGQDTGRPCAVGEELAAILLSGKAQSDGVLLQCNWAVAHHAIKAEARNVQHFFSR